jgi:hypothetical protein
LQGDGLRLQLWQGDDGEHQGDELHAPRHDFVLAG